MADPEDNIPTLTDITHAGKQDMLNHFNAHQFNDEAADANNDANNDESNDEDADEINNELSFSFENASEIAEEVTDEITGETTDEIADEFIGISKTTIANEIPSITLEDEGKADISNEDFAEAMQAIPQKISEQSLDKDDLKEKINQAINEALPGIEAQLKGKLYSKFGI